MAAATVSPSPPKTVDPPLPPVDELIFDLDKRQNYFTLYLGVFTAALFVCIFVFAFVKKRDYPVVTQLAKPDTDSHVHEYVVVIKTSFKRQADLTLGARLALQLLGRFCDSRRHVLTQKFVKQMILHRSHVDIFLIYAPMDIGEVLGVRFTLFNFSQEAVASWNPCFVEVIKSSTRERWAANITSPIEATGIHVATIKVLKGCREENSCVKLVLQNHWITSIFFHPQRLGCYTTFTQILFFFWSQSTLMLSVMFSYILANQSLGKMSHTDVRNVWQDNFPFTQLTNAVVSIVLHQVELALHSVRPAPGVVEMLAWKGLWKNIYPPNLMHCNVEYDWDRPPEDFDEKAHTFSEETSMSTLSDEDLPHSDESESSLISEEEDDVDSPFTKKKHETTQKKSASINMVRLCTRKSKECYTYAAKPESQTQGSQFDIKLGTGNALYADKATCVESTNMTRLIIPTPRAYCQFCLWVKHVNIRGEDLRSYCTHLTFNIRRCVLAIKSTKDPKLAMRVLTICINQWVASLCSRMLKEVVGRMLRERLIPGALGTLLAVLRNTESNLWFAEVGHRAGALAGSRDTSHNVSTTFFAILRHLSKAAKASHEGVKGIMHRDYERIVPSEGKKKITWDNKLVKSYNILRWADITDMMDNLEQIEDDKTQQNKHEARPPPNNKILKRRATMATTTPLMRKTLPEVSSNSKNYHKAKTKATHLMRKILPEASSNSFQKDLKAKTNSNVSNAALPQSTPREVRVTIDTCNSSTLKSISQSRPPPPNDQPASCSSRAVSSLQRQSEARGLTPKDVILQIMEDITEGIGEDLTENVAAKLTEDWALDIAEDLSDHMAEDWTEGTSLLINMEPSPEEDLGDNPQREQVIVGRPGSGVAKHSTADGDSRNECNSSLYPESSDSDPDSDPMVDNLLFRSQHSLSERQSLKGEWEASRNPSAARRRAVGQRGISGQHSPHICSLHGAPPSRRTGAGNAGNSSSNSPTRKEPRDRSNSNDPPKKPSATPERQKTGSSTHSSKTGPSSKRGSLTLGIPTRIKKLFGSTKELILPKPETSGVDSNWLHGLCDAFEAYANIVVFEVSKMKKNLCHCCDQRLCQTYAVIFTQLRHYVYPIIYEVLCHNVDRRNDAKLHDGVVEICQKQILASIDNFIVSYCNTMQKLGKPQVPDAFSQFLNKKNKNKNVPAEYPLGSLDSLQWNWSSNYPVDPPDKKGEKGRSDCSVKTSGTACPDDSAHVDSHNNNSTAGVDLLTKTDQSPTTSGSAKTGRSAQTDYSNNMTKETSDDHSPKLDGSAETDPSTRKDRSNNMAYETSKDDYGDMQDLDQLMNIHQEDSVDSMPAKEYTSFDFGYRKTGHGMIYNWEIVPIPLDIVIWPPLFVMWTPNKNHGEVINASHSVDEDDICPGQIPTLGLGDTPTDDASQLESKEWVDQMLHPKCKCIVPLVRRLINECRHEIWREVDWVLGIKEHLATVVAFARIDISTELDDPLKIAIQDFTHALLILLFEAMLPRDGEDIFTVSADDIRQRRKRISSTRTPGLFDLSENNDPGYDLNMLDFIEKLFGNRTTGLFDLNENNDPGYDLSMLGFIVVKLCERWEMAKVELHFSPTMMFLSRCLTMANLDVSMMEHMEDIVLGIRPGREGLAMRKMTHVHEAQHALAEVVNEVMAISLSHVVPETLKAMLYIERFLRNEEERVDYVCEKVCVMEYQIRHKLSRRIQQASTQKVQDVLGVFASRQNAYAKTEEHMISRLRNHVHSHDYYITLEPEELLLIKEELQNMRKQLSIIKKIEDFEMARQVSKYARNTTRLQHHKVRDTQVSMTEAKFNEPEYTFRQFLEVEWIVGREMEKPLPSIVMNVAMSLLFISTMINLMLVTVLGASFTPEGIGKWFGLVGLGIVMNIFLTEPFKCLWYYDFGWEQPTDED